MDLIEAIMNNDVIKVVRMLENGIDPNEYQDNMSLTPLHFAVQSNAIDVVILLITAGADIDLETEDELTALDIARNNNNEEMVSLLGKIIKMKQRYIM